LKLQSTRRGAITVLSLSGDFDLASRSQFSEALAKIDGESERLIVDLRRVMFMDSSGLRMLLELWSESRRDGFSLAIVRGQTEVQKVLEITGADEVLPMIDVPPRR
jgi:anti-sigma B factor antagonist